MFPDEAVETFFYTFLIVEDNCEVSIVRAQHGCTDAKENHMFYFTFLNWLPITPVGSKLVFLPSFTNSKKTMCGDPTKLQYARW